MDSEIEYLKNMIIRIHSNNMLEERAPCDDHTIIVTFGDVFRAYQGIFLSDIVSAICVPH